MKYGIMGASVPLMVKKMAFAYLKEKSIDVDPALVKSEYKKNIQTRNRFHIIGKNHR